MPQTGNPIRRILGRVESGRIVAGDDIEILLGRRRSRIKSIEASDGDVMLAQAPSSGVIVLEDNLDVARGDMLAAAVGGLLHVMLQHAGL